MALHNTTITSLTLVGLMKSEAVTITIKTKTPTAVGDKILCEEYDVVTMKLTGRSILVIVDEVRHTQEPYNNKWHCRVVVRDYSLINFK